MTNMVEANSQSQNLSSQGSDSDEIADATETDHFLNNMESADVKDEPAVKLVGNRPLYKVVTIVLLALCLALLLSLVIIVTVTERCPKLSTKKDQTLVRSLRFLQISDTHYDLYYNSSLSYLNQTFCRTVSPMIPGHVPAVSDNVALYGRMNCDTPPLLVKVSAAEMKRVSDTEGHYASFALITGDQAAHSYDLFNVQGSLEDNILWSVFNSTQLIADALPGIPLFPSFGNNDFPSDYMPPTADTAYWYDKFLTVWEPLIRCSSCREVDRPLLQANFQDLFRQGGYYRADLSDRKLTVLSLNTLYWSLNAYGRNPNITALGDRQMSWIEAELSLAEKESRKIILFGHIPPGVSNYPGTGATYLQNYTRRYVELTSSLYAGVIVAQVYGHTHQDLLAMQYANDAFPVLEQQAKKMSFLMIAPGISPVYQNNPAFRLYFLDDDTYALANFKQYYMDLMLSNVLGKPIWQLDYSFADLYMDPATPYLSAEVVHGIFSRMMDPDDGGKTWLKYVTNTQARYLSSGQTRPINFCSGRHSTLSNFEKCMEFYKNAGD